MTVNLTMDCAVKIDKELMGKIEELIKKEKFLYTSKKQVVNLALVEFLENRNIKKKENLNNTKRGKHG